MLFSGLLPMELTVLGDEALFSCPRCRRAFRIVGADGTSPDTHEVIGIAGVDAAGINPLFLIA
jgi:hypothetical protein